MQNSLKNSVYLRDRDDVLAKTEEIMREDGTPAINDSVSKPTMKYHQFEKAMMKSNDNLQTFAFTTAQTDHEVQQPENLSPPKVKTKRPCQDSFQYLINRHSIPAKIEEPAHVKQTRERLVRQHEERRAGKIEVFKTNLLRRINFQVDEESESSIQAQIIQGPQVKQAKVQSFLKRQQFFAHQKQILRDMRQFCTYGAIRLP